jgi:hypothetical protein
MAMCVPCIFKDGVTACVNLCTQDAEGGQALFIDGGVYTRNRAFRLFQSSKAGKDAVLQPTGKQSPPAHSRVPMRH